MTNSVFKIRNLTRRLNGKTIVSVPSLDIKRGYLVVLLGNSGCGKTTLLETLGLMSQAYNPDDNTSQIIFYPNSSSPGYDYHTLWLNKKQLSYVRNEHMSFILQQTNLFPQFNVAENIALGKVICGDPFDDPSLKKNVLKIVQDLDIEDRKDAFSKDISGGEQQRAAFARAEVKDFTILFGDEPTGNLGRKDAETVMERIHHCVKNSNSTKSAIVVTHNTSLATKFADCLIVMSQDGVIEPGNVHEAVMNEKEKQWPTITKESDKLEDKIHQLMDLELRGSGKAESHVSKIQITHTDYEELGANYDSQFKRFFHSKQFEGLSLWSITGAVLTLVLFMAWLAIGFSKGSLDYLEDKMSDPFINWLSVDIPHTQQDQLPVILDTLRSARYQQEFFVKHINGFNRFALYSWDEKRLGSYVSFGRTIDVNDPILSRILVKENTIHSGRFKSSNDYSLIVSQDFLDNFFLANAEPPSFFKMSYDTEAGENLIPVPISAIVKNLPGKNDFICTPYFYNQLFMNPANPFNPKHTGEFILYTSGNRDRAWEISDSLQTFFSVREEKYANLNPYISPPGEYDLTFSRGATVRTAFDEKPELELLRSLFEDFRQSGQGKPFFGELEHLYSTTLGASVGSAKYDKISISISKLDEVSSLKTSLEESFNLEIDMAKVESLRNYNFVAGLTESLSWAIIIISILSVSIFASYMLYIYLYRNRIYIGSFTAFGITDATMQQIYLKRMTILIATALAISVALACGFGYTGALIKLLSSFSSIERNGRLFNLLNEYPVYFLAVLVVFCYTSLYLTAKYFLDHTPSDLIHDRIGKGRTSPPIHHQLRYINGKQRGSVGAQLAGFLLKKRLSASR